MDSEFDAAIEGFPWESEEQKQGYLALVQYERRFGYMPNLPLDTKALFFIQKDIESHAYWTELSSTQVSDLQNILADTRERLDRCLSRVDQLEITVRGLLGYIDSLTKK